MKIRFHGMLGTLHSYSFVSQALARAMDKFGHQVHLKSTNSLEFFPNDLKRLLLPGYHNIPVAGNAEFLTESGDIITVSSQSPIQDIPDKNKPYDLELAYTILFQSPRRFYQESRCRAVIWNFESSILPSGWHLYARALDYFLPSSQFSYDIFAANGIPKDKMLVVPHGVDTSIFNPNIPPFKLKTEKKIKLLHNAIPHARKCHDRVLRGYFDAFTGDDDVCLVMKTKLLKPDPKNEQKCFEVDVQEIIDKEKKGRKNPPEIELVTEFVDDMGSLYTACDAVVSMSATEGFCLLPETFIDTDNGFVPIKNIKENSYVYTHTGTLKKVTQVKFRKINEKIIKLKRHGCSIYFCGTKDHPHLVVQKPLLSLKFNKLKDRFLNKTLKAKWIKLSEIKKHDLIVIPKPKLNKYQTIDTIDIKNFLYELNFIEENGKIWLNGSLKKDTGNSSLKIISKKAGCSFQYASDVFHKRCPGTSEFAKKILNICKELQYKKPEPIKFDRFINIDDDIAIVFGLYIAEGCASKNIVNFCLNKNETYGHNKIISVLSRLNVPFSKRIIDNKCEIVASSKILSTILKKMFGDGALQKRIPFTLYNSKFILKLIHGIFYGDGTASAKVFSFSTSSIGLVYDLFYILLGNGIFPYISEDKRKENINYTISIPKQFNSKFINLIKPIKYNNYIYFPNGKRNNAIIESEDAFLVPVSSVEETDYNGTVYNLEIDEDHSFTSFGMVTHNCLPLLEAMACNTVSIAPRHGGQLDFLNDKNSLLVNTGEMKAPKVMQYWEYNENAVVGDPDTKHFSELLRRFYENPEKEKARVSEEAKKTVETFTWERAAKMILDLPIPQKSMRIPEKRKVLYIIPYGSVVGGAETWVKEAIKTLDKTKYEPSVAFVMSSNPELYSLFNDVKIEDLSNQGKDRALKCLLESETYSIVHFYNSFGIYNLLRSMWHEGYRCRIVETVHSELMWGDSMAKVGIRDNCILAIASVSSSLAQKLLRIGNRNVFEIPQHIDWDKFTVNRSKEILKELNIPNRFTVGFVGRISPEKNITAIIQCAKLLENINFVIVGDGPQLGPLKALSSRLPNVYFVGKRNDVDKFYNAFDVIMLTSLMEGFPLVLLEAISCGTPVISSNVGAISDFINDNGFLIKNSNDIKSYVKSINDLTNIDTWNKFSAKSVEISKICRERAKQVNINTFYNKLFKGD